MRAEKNGNVVIHCDDDNVKYCTGSAKNLLAVVTTGAEKKWSSKMPLGPCRKGRWWPFLEDDF